MLKVLGRIVGMAFDSDNPDSVADRNRVLDVLFAQIAQTRARRAARRRYNQPDDAPDDAPGDALDDEIGEEPALASAAG